MSRGTQDTLNLNFILIHLVLLLIDRFGGWESTNTETKQEYLLYGLQCNVHVYVCARHIFVLFDFTNDLSV